MSWPFQGCHFVAQNGNPSLAGPDKLRDDGEKKNCDEIVFGSNVNSPWKGEKVSLQESS